MWCLLLNFTSIKLINCSNLLTSKITIMNIERTEFIVWMERIMERFDILKEQVINNQSRFIEVDGEQLLDNQDVLQLLKISSRSLQRYRTNKKLPYYTISGKLYYKLSDVHQLIRESLKSWTKKTASAKWVESVPYSKNIKPLNLISNH